MKAMIDEVFSAVLGPYFLDGTKIEADTNKHMVVWVKRR